MLSNRLNASNNIKGGSFLDDFFNTLSDMKTDLFKKSDESSSSSSVSNIADDFNSAIDEIKESAESTKDADNAAKGTKTWSNINYSSSRGTSMGAYGYVIEEIQKLEKQVEAIQMKMGAMNVVMDSGALVGQIAPKMDKALGNAAILQGRQ